jgi:hypothetical protein
MALTLTIREELGIDRVAELVEGGVPFPEGKVHDPDQLRLSHPSGMPVALQTSVLERWPDGSARWVSLAFLGDVQAQSAAIYTLETNCAELPVQPRTRVSVSENKDGVGISTGAVSFVVRRQRFDPLGGLAGLERTDLRVARADGRAYSAAAAVDTELTIAEAGPIVARVLARGTHGDGEGGTFLGFEVEVEAVAGSSEIAVAYRIVNRESGRQTGVAAWNTSICLAGPTTSATCGTFDAVHRTTGSFLIRHRGEGHSRGIFPVSELSSEAEWEDASDPAYRNRWEWSELSGRHASNWLSVELPANESLSVVVPQFGDTQPSDLGFDGGSVYTRFWPADAGVLELTQGMAPCGRFVVRVGAGNADAPQRFAGRREIRLVPDPTGRPLDTGAVPPTLARDPQRFPRLESHIREELFSWYLGGQTSGLLDRGDCFQVRLGPRTGFTANNEHDALYALCLHYLRSGERAYLESAEAYGDHLVDVDLIHHSDQNAFETGGLRAHGVGHVHYVPARTLEGATETSIDTGHMWVEGLLLLAALTGRRRYRDAACAVGDCLLGLIEVGWTRPEPGPRNSGWPLVALSALYRSTLDRRYLEGARRVARQALAAQGADGRWTMKVGFHDGYCAWQNAVLLVGLARLRAIDDDPAVERGLRAGIEALLELGRYDDGGFIYLDRFDYRWVSRQAQIREALAAAHALTDDERYLVAGLEGGNAAWLRSRGQGPALSNDIAEWRGQLPFLHALDRAGMLRDLNPDEIGRVAAE